MTISVLVLVTARQLCAEALEPTTAACFLSLSLFLSLFVPSWDPAPPSSPIEPKRRSPRRQAAFPAALTVRRGCGARRGTGGFCPDHRSGEPGRRPRPSVLQPLSQVRGRPSGRGLSGSCSSG